MIFIIATVAADRCSAHSHFSASLPWLP